MIINLCGFGWSGSGAYVDLLREYDEVWLPSQDSWEFNFLWAPDGLYDLEQKLCMKHCRIFDSFLAIERFLEIAKIYGSKSGYNYDKYFAKPFYQQCEDYINKLIQFQLETYCFVHRLHPTLHDKLVLYYNGILGRLFGNRLLWEFDIFRNIFYKCRLNNFKQVSVSYNPEDFIDETQKFIDSLISQLRPDKDKVLLLDQSVPPDMPLLCEHFFKEQQKTIVIRRDPRDQFVTINELQGIPRPVPTNVDDFILFYRKTIADTKLPDSDQILSLNFEDLIYDYNKTVEKTEAFLGISMHNNPLKYFDPQKSINNTQLKYKYPKYENEINKIESELSDCLFSFDRNFKRTTGTIF